MPACPYTRCNPTAEVEVCSVDLCAVRKALADGSHCLQRLGTAVVFSAIYYKALSRRGSPDKAAVARTSSLAAEGMTRHCATAGSVSAGDFERVSLVDATATSPLTPREGA